MYFYTFYTCKTLQMSPATPAHATEAPSIGKVWWQLKSSLPTFATLWGFRTPLNKSSGGGKVER